MSTAADAALRSVTSSSSPCASVNIATVLPEMARRQPDAHAIHAPVGRRLDGRPAYASYTYRQLDEESDRIARGLGTIGIGRGTRTVLMVKPSLEFFALTFALFKAGVVPVLVDPGMGIRNLKACIAEAEAEAFIGIPKAHVARLLLGWGRATIRRVITVGPRLFWGGWTLAEVKRRGGDGRLEAAATRADEIAAILFTSGSTGVPKGAVYTHGNFAAQVEKVRDTYDIRPGEIDLPTFPLFALFDPALGMTTVVPDMDPSRPASADPAALVAAIHEFGATNMFGSPAVIDRLARYGEPRGVKLPSLRRVLCAGAPVPARLLERFSRLLAPETQVFTPYGATEALPVASIGSHEVLGETRARTEAGAGICVGRPVAGMEVRILPISDEAVPTWDDALALPVGEIGEIVVRGPTVTRSYWKREASTALAKIREKDGTTIRHRMGDLGYLDDRGRIWFCGRKSHRVVTPAGTLFTIPCEAVFNTHPAVFRTALVGVRRGGGGDGAVEPVLCVERDPDVPRVPDARLREELLALGAAREHTRPIRTLLFHPRFPVDVRHNAKIFREKLAVWAERKLGWR
ncbi:MAG: AMP-binding protein [Planctomycetes bacterium]|nr:AMP-binding protein [Planctomycetota bacterium]